MFFTQPNFIIAGVCLFIFYAMGKEEAKSGKRDLGMWWALLSAIGSGIVIGGFHGGWLPVFITQVVLFFSIGVVRTLLDKQR